MGRLLPIVGGTILLVAAGSPARALDPQPGQWEISTKRESGGTVTQRPPRTMCMTAEKAKQVTTEISRIFPTGEFSNRGTTCKVVELKKTDKEVTWRAECTGLFPAEQTGRYVIDNPQRFESTVHSSVKAGQTTLASTLTTEGRRTGECQK